VGDPLSRARRRDANELHVPVSDSAVRGRRSSTLESADAPTALVPRVAGKTDLIPNKTNRMWVEPHQPGTYHGPVCRILWDPARHMLLRVVAEPPEQFAAGEQQRQKAATARRPAAAAAPCVPRTACITVTRWALSRPAGTGRISPISCPARPSEPASANTRTASRLVRTGRAEARVLMRPAARRRTARSARRVPPHPAL